MEQSTIFSTLKHYGVYKALCKHSGYTKTEHAFYSYRNHTSLRCDLEDLYCKTLVDNINCSSIILLEKLQGNSSDVL